MKFLFLGNYSNAGLSGFLKNPEDDRRAAISAMVEKSGGKFIDLQFLRGKYDIAVVAEVSSFEDAAAVKVLVAGIRSFRQAGDDGIYRYERYCHSSKQNNWCISRTRCLNDGLKLL